MTDEKETAIKTAVKKAESMMSLNYAIEYGQRKNGTLDPEDVEPIDIDTVMTAPFGEDVPVQCHHVHHGIDQRCSEDSILALYVKNPMDNKKAWYATCEEHTVGPSETLIKLLDSGETIDTSDL